MDNFWNNNIVQVKTSFGTIDDIRQMLYILQNGKIKSFSIFNVSGHPLLLIENKNGRLVGSVRDGEYFSHNNTESVLNSILNFFKDKK